MKILVVSQYFWPENFRINDLATGLKDRGHQVTVLTGIPNYPGGRFFTGYGFFRRTTETYKGIRVIRVTLMPRGKGGSFRLTVNYLSFVFFASIIGPFRCRGQFDVILVYEPSPVTVGLVAIVLKAIKHAPLMFWVQDLWPESLEATGAVCSAWLLRMVESLVRFIYRQCDRILVQSEAFFQPIRRLVGDGSRILYFPNSAEEIYEPMKLPPGADERSVLPSGFRVMFAGNIGAAQDFETILRAADLLRDYQDIHWVILGDGRMRSWVEQQVKEQKLDQIVHLLGRYPIETMPRFFSLADVMLVTLKKEPIFALTIPAKVQSYMACGKPIVGGLDGEGARVIEEAGAGIASPAGDPRALADSILKMRDMSADGLAAMGWRGRDYFKKHFERKMLIQRLEEWMKELSVEK